MNRLTDEELQNDQFRSDDYTTESEPNKNTELTKHDVK